MPTALCFGELLIDMVSQTPDASLQDATQFLRAPGGAPANVAVGLARHGISTGFIGSVGNDPFGHSLRDTLAREEVDVSGLKLSDEARTTIAWIGTRSDGAKDVSFHRQPGADMMLRPEDIAPTLFDGTKLFHCGSVSLSAEPCRGAQLHAVQMARQAGALISYDPNWRPDVWGNPVTVPDEIWQMMPLTDIVKLADEEWEFVTGTSDFEIGARRIREAGPRLVVVTRGEHGAWFQSGQGSGEVPGFKVAFKDSLGAGDSFMAGLLSRVLEAPSLDEVLNEASLRDIVRFANACGALATLEAGAIPALPGRARVEAFLKSQ